MIAYDHKGKTYYRSRFHWQIKIETAVPGLRFKVVTYRRLTPEVNGKLLNELERAFQNFIKQLHAPT